MESQPSVIEKPDHKNRNIVIVVIVIILVFCCCLVAGIVGFYALTSISSKQSTPIQPAETLAPASGNSDPSSNTGIGDAPSGGLGNDILRNDTWKVMAPAAVGLGCDQPSGANSTIEILQKPDASGHWIEKWTVVCESGKTYAFKVDFTLDSTGTTYKIKSLP